MSDATTEAPGDVEQGENTTELGASISDLVAATRDEDSA